MSEVIPGDTVYCVLPNGKTRPITVVEVIDHGEEEENRPTVPTIRGNVHVLKEDGYPDPVVSLGFRYSDTDEDRTGRFPVLTWHFKEALKPNPKPEPAEGSDTEGSLPSDFPGRVVLRANGITTYEQVRAGGDLTRFPGISGATAAEIADALARRPRSDQPPVAGRREGQLPVDFPARAALRSAGINTYAEARAAGDLTELPGIGETTAAKIATLLAAPPE